MSLYNSYRYRRNKLTPICVITAAFLMLIYVVNLKSSPTYNSAELHKQEENGSPLDSTPERAGSSNNMACPRPDLPIDNPDIMQFIEKRDPIKCDEDPDWVVVDGHTASLTKEAIEVHGEKTSCKFTEWKRIDDNQKVEGETREGQTFEFTSTDYCTVECTGGDAKTWSNTLYGIRKDIPREGKYPDEGMGINFVALGFDSLSHNMFMRQLPKTYRYLTEELDVKVLNGYNIVGDGTPQAITPMLTGQTELELPEVRRAATYSDYVNSYPMAWKNFKEAGYVTMYWEDTPDINTYNYRLNGFKEQPTDHYARPFYQLVKYNSHPKLCIRSQPRHKTFLDNIHNYMKTYRNRPYFYFSIHGELSHDDINLVSIADDDVLNLLKDLKKENLLDNTLFSLYSDHGSRFQKVRATQQGKQEERMPFVSYIVPQTLKERFPQAYQNLITNLDRLASPFDIHATLMDILHFTANETGSLSNRKISFFSEIPKERTCQHAGIDPHWCACLNWDALDVTDVRAVAAANALVDHLNELTSPHRKLCQTLSIKNLHSVGLLLPDNDMMDFVGNADNDGFVPKMGANQQVTVEKYEVKLGTQPGDAMYEATLSYDRRTQAFSLKNTDISLITKYGEKSSCILDVDPQLLKYCIC